MPHAILLGEVTQSCSCSSRRRHLARTCCIVRATAAAVPCRLIPSNDREVAAATSPSRRRARAPRRWPWQTRRWTRARATLCHLKEEDGKRHVAHLLRDGRCVITPFVMIFNITFRGLSKVKCSKPSQAETMKQFVNVG